MSDKTTTKILAFRMLPGWLGLLVLLFTLTGNCSVCGFDKDYLGAVVGVQPSQESAP